MYYYCISAVNGQGEGTKTDVLKVKAVPTNAIYENDFSSEEALSGWQFQDASKAEIVEEDGNQVLHFRGNTGAGESGNGYAVAYYPGSGWTNYCFEADFKVNDFLSLQEYSGLAIKSHYNDMNSFFAGVYYLSLIHI